MFVRNIRYRNIRYWNINECCFDLISNNWFYWHISSEMIPVLILLYEASKALIVGRLPETPTAGSFQTLIKQFICVKISKEINTLNHFSIFDRIKSNCYDSFERTCRIFFYVILYVHHQKYNRIVFKLNQTMNNCVSYFIELWINNEINI